MLITLCDDRPVPKVIDFGVAKATSPRPEETTVFTQFGQIVGTLEYMSPEQASLNPLDVDTRSDIYSLGALLYELLVGVTPFDGPRLRAAPLDAKMRIIREEEPPKPSARLSSGEYPPSLAANRGMELKKLSALVHGELDWIVMKALDLTSELHPHDRITCQLLLREAEQRVGEGSPAADADDAPE